MQFSHKNFIKKMNEWISCVLCERIPPAAFVQYRMKTYQPKKREKRQQQKQQKNILKNRLILTNFFFFFIPLPFRSTTNFGHSVPVSTHSPLNAYNTASNSIVFFSSWRESNRAIKERKEHELKTFVSSL